MSEGSGSGNGSGSGSGTGEGSGSGNGSGAGNGSGSGSGSGTEAACTNATYDPCTSAAQCTSGICQTFAAAGIEVCTVNCTPGDSTTCPQQNGQPATCNNMGICKPSAANVCSR